ncbi:hypothetical protein K437DRAFT_134711 [Tilletiaria anomala UBC 951]|uniref:Cora-domain-containing protein n=1 Tax=Tilletiaria anomala (strain ATCC 24038 / CBS 436.72 / UBC 951) TaxID=1037660 RepID=A0A066WGR4_TILAU|nr:uncharacterized protein K437DRAFT_134711 [Tilletiaria anomala UBC 951]KDN52991.1 hypothetical protein K437DRAFT_134711 [Tilletiaria anomala UBC 951]
MIFKEDNDVNSFEMQERNTEKVLSKLGSHTADSHKDLQTTAAQSKKARVDIIEGLDGKEGVEGVSVGAVNLYLVVFTHGVISFHFDDVSKHTDYVLKRLVDLSQPVDLTSDWIAHGLYDSVVDAFFPLLSFVETELVDLEQEAGDPTDPTMRADHIPVDEIRAITYSARNGHDDLPFTVLQTRRTKLRYALRWLNFIHLPLWLAERLPNVLIEQQYQTKIKTETSASLLDRVRYGTGKKALETPEAFKSRTALEQSNLLRRITQTRKIATGMLRLLAPKNDAVRGLRKRLTELRSASMARTEVSIYLGDVHDHIIALLAQLQINEAHLGDLHYSYLSSLTIYNRRIRQHADRKIITLATITLTIVTSVFITSLFSFNVKIPGNDLLGPDHWWFGIVIAIMCTNVLIILTWRWCLFKRAHRRLTLRRAAR